MLFYVLFTFTTVFVIIIILILIDEKVHKYATSNSISNLLLADEGVTSCES